MKKAIYSWIMPIKNEALSLPQLIREIVTTMSEKRFEIVAVNDASQDKTLEILFFLKKKIPQLTVINLSSHRGKWGAIYAGFKKTRGEIIITLDSDLQDDPRELTKLLPKVSMGYDVVSGWRKTRSDPYYKILISNLGNQLVSFLTGRKFHDLNSSFKVYKREVIEILPKAGSLFRFSLLFADKYGFKVAEAPIVHRPRLYGRSKFGIVKYLRIIYDLLLVLLLFSGSGRLEKDT